MRSSARGGWRRRSAIAACVIGGLMALPAVADAYQVQISITGAGQVTETTPANLVGSGCASPSSTPTGALGRTCAAGTTSGTYSYGWDVDYVATPAPGYTFKHWISTPGHSWNPVICDRSTPAATTPTYTGGTCKFRTFDNLQTRAVFEDLTAPARPLVSPAPAGSATGPVDFTMSRESDPTFSRYVCQISGDGDPYYPYCGGGSLRLNPPNDGTYTLRVWSEDYSGNQSGPAVERTVTFDRTAPQTALGVGGPVEGSSVSSKSASFSFTSSESGSFRCSLDGSPPATCSGAGSQAYSNLSEGPHEFRVWAVDTAGNMDLTPAQRSWTVDSVAPETTLDPATGPGEGSTTASTDAIFQFSGSEAGLSFRCSLDGAALAQCPTPKVLSGLADGSHVFRVWAVDSAGNTDATPAERRWSVDTTPDQPGGPPPGQPSPPLEPPAPDASACDAAIKKASAAKAKVRKLKSAGAPRDKVAKAKKRAKKLAQAAAQLCSSG